MAMQFGEADLNAVVDTCFRRAVARTGFELRLATDRQPAGIIDDQMRVAIRTARFVLADLTHQNSGAYWEAGFAEGLGKLVIYTCREQEWSEHRAHFDTNHPVTIKWRADDLAAAAEGLVNTIRATLPEEATMTDG
jgi:nucleoside 2-deoxyribosyltransferase